MRCSHRSFEVSCDTKYDLGDEPEEDEITAKLVVTCTVCGWRWSGEDADAVVDAFVDVQEELEDDLS